MKEPESFDEWISWKLGRCIAENYMIPYNKKIWSIDLKQLGTYWLYKLPNVSFSDTLQSCLDGKAKGDIPAHGTFLYPKKYGYGEVWRRMGKLLGDQLITRCDIKKIDINNRIINGRWKAEKIISTIPWTVWPFVSDLPPEIELAIKSLEKSSIDVDYYPETYQTQAHWVYEPDERLPHHRLLIRSNFTEGRGYWTETNSKRSLPSGGIRFHNEYAYPINTLNKINAIKKIQDWSMKVGIIGLGRWGRWEHMNSDIAVAEAIDLADELI